MFGGKKLKGEMYSLGSKIMELEMANSHIREQLEVLRDRLNCQGGNVKAADIISCETCGCLIYRSGAVKGKSEIRTRKKFVKNDHDYSFCEVDEEYIYTPHYCKVHGQEKGGWE